MREGHYASARAFDKEMSMLFLKARRYYGACTEPYGHILVLQVRAPSAWRMPCGTPFEVPLTP